MALEDPQMKIRLPLELKELLDNAAKSAGRTLNAEVVARLMQSFNPRVPQEFYEREELMKTVTHLIDQRLAAAMLKK